MQEAMERALIQYAGCRYRYDFHLRISYDVMTDL